MNRILCYLNQSPPRPTAAQRERDRLNDLLAGSVEAFVKDNGSLGFFLDYVIEPADDVAVAGEHLALALRAIILDLSVTVERLEGGAA